ncbi:phytanoyl-CoA dioxygenase [Seminavis robusta]|uniref:Phytanoyl-CoA dioxygenase n=1 Tax=Seminavis robusta TaxID=568900 RepID=A0A9N8DLY1_9STRA|nr:phytanoyl-CoA dioxygenase [Seminavis robusta]|eukprot:Sro217_g089670.1 phytanoyl-CoA dioxygenase (349) ;mRNA; r:28270-29316
MGAPVDENEEVDSADEALLELLGLSSLDAVKGDDDENDDREVATNSDPQDQLLALDAREFENVSWTELITEYHSTGICVVPSSLHVPSELMRRMTDELVWGGNTVQADKTYETIKVWKQGELQERRTLTRLENFVDYHDGWKSLCHGYLRRVISALLGEEMVLFKEKLNLKPPGGSGFAPHLDGPSLRVALEEGPTKFVTVMVAIDNMTSQNGCLRVCKGAWSEASHCPVVEPEEDGNPDAGGRAGAIPSDVAETMDFEDIGCPGGAIAAFSDWAPHRSAANQSPFSRRAVFLTYNPASQGDFHAAYYQKMQALRDEWKTRIGLDHNRTQWEQDQQNDLAGLATIPRI